jgi:hypothetical protein
MKKVFFVVDADGNRLDNEKPKTPRSSPMKIVKTVKMGELDDLEDAIFEDDNARAKFLDMYGKDPGSFDDFLKKFAIRKKRTVAHCWKNLNWRPSADKRKVLILAANPYKKARKMT